MLSTKEKEAIEKSISHWKRMFEFAEKTKIYGHIMMKKTLGETYNSEYCDLCIFNTKGRKICCVNCILANRHVECSHKDSVWFTVNKARTLEAWLDAAKKMLTILQAILEGHDFREFDKDGYSQFGYDINGYDRNGYDADGYDINGYNEYGYDIEGYDVEGYDRSEYNREGYDRDGYDRDNYDRDGYDINGCKKLYV